MEKKIIEKENVLRFVLQEIFDMEVLFAVNNRAF